MTAVTQIDARKRREHIPIGFRISPQGLQLIDSLAKQVNVTRSELIRVAVETLATKINGE